jgi:isoleucyl-tRNA synthetase
VADTHDNMTIVLDTELNDELIEEGLAREIVNKVNTMRREIGLEITDRISLVIDSDEAIRNAFMKHKTHICHETLAIDVKFEKTVGTTWDLNGHQATILLSCQVS